MAAAPGGAEAVRVEERKVGPRHRVHGQRSPRLLGSPRIPQSGRSLERGTLFVPRGLRGLSASIHSGWSRDESLARMADEVFDVCVIGGGINGAAVARDAAMRGLSVALVDAGDFAGATSSRSSKL